MKKCPTLPVRPFALSVSLLLAACQGQIAHPGDDDSFGGEAAGGSSGARGSRGDETDIVPSGAVGPAPMRRLNRREFNNAVRDLLADSSNPADGWTGNAALSGFDTDASGQDTTELEVDQFRIAAEQVAENAIKAAKFRIDCDPATAGEMVCAAAFIDRFAGRAYRRPLTADEKARLKSVFDAGRREGDYSEGLRGVIQTVLQSPYFLYRPELGGVSSDPRGAAPVALTSHELASRLAFFLTGTIPDTILRKAADDDTLRTTEAIANQVRRLLGRKDAQATLETFHHQWLDLARLDGQTRDPKLFPNFGPALVSSLQAGTAALARHLYLERMDGRLGELFTAPYVFVDGTSAPTYGLPASSSKEIKKTMAAEPRAGLLTDAALMTALSSATESKPVSRGKFVRTKLLCQSVPKPPDNMNIDIPPPDPKLTTRERYAKHRVGPCATCHDLFDPIGLTFESYDAVGRYRKTENGKVIDVSGELTGTAGSDGAFQGAVELGQRLAKSPEVASGLVKAWLAFGLGRGAAPEDGATVTTLGSFLGGPEGSLRELLVKIATSSAFRFRPPVDLHVGDCQ